MADLAVRASRLRRRQTRPCQTIEVPADLAAALGANPKARAMFQNLSRQNRYAILYRVTTAKREETSARRVEQFVDMLERGKAPYPQSG
jgi:uncharacterized protein YdeI (YjbR/CyaY-like superfamily)